LPVILGDRFRVQQLFQNIISNAIAHNDKKERIVVIDCIESAKVIFSVTDNGPELLKKIKEEYSIRFNH
jgi:signal transduction histidine kinase